MYLKAVARHYHT